MLFNGFKQTSHAFSCTHTHKHLTFGHSKMCGLISSGLIVCLKNLSNLQWAQTPIRVNKHTQPHARFTLHVLNNSAYQQLPSVRGQMLSVTEPTQILIMWFKAMMLRCFWSKANTTPLTQLLMECVVVIMEPHSPSVHKHWMNIYHINLSGTTDGSVIYSSSPADTPTDTKNMFSITIIDSY